MRSDRPFVVRASLVGTLFLLAACAARSPESARDMGPPLLLTDENFYGLLGAEPVHPNEAMARVAMAECAAMGDASVEGVGSSADAARLEAVRQLSLALSRAGANAFSLRSQRWEADPAGAVRLVVVVQALICSA